MVNYIKDIEYKLLKLVSEQDGPIGAGFIFDSLQNDNDLVLSEATIGRYLRRFEQLGYLESVRYNGRSRGRIITEKGTQRLRECAFRRQQRESISDVMNLLDKNLDKHLRNVLVARKIVEPEMAALAAQNATTENLVAIRKVLDEMERLTAEGKSMASTDDPFHTEIARACGNPIIESILKIARTDQDYSPEIEYIVSSSSRKVPSDHWHIYEAIEEHNPEKARRIMAKHIERIIQRLDDYEREILEKEQ